jgi:hypothetical protein
MRHVLLVLTRPEDPLDATLREATVNTPDTQVETVDLRGENPDYPRLLQAIFLSDSVQVW